MPLLALEVCSRARSSPPFPTSCTSSFNGPTVFSWRHCCFLSFRSFKIIFFNEVRFLALGTSLCIPFFIRRALESKGLCGVFTWLKWWPFFPDMASSERNCLNWKHRWCGGPLSALEVLLVFQCCQHYPKIQLYWNLALLKLFSGCYLD